MLPKTGEPFNIGKVNFFPGSTISSRIAVAGTRISLQTTTAAGLLRCKCGIVRFSKEDDDGDDDDYDEVLVYQRLNHNQG